MSMPCRKCGSTNTVVTMADGPDSGDGLFREVGRLLERLASQLQFHSIHAAPPMEKNRGAVLICKDYGHSGAL